MNLTTRKNHEYASRGAECEFCREFEESETSFFAHTYAGSARSRIIEKRGGIVVLPTIGQLFTGSLLIMPLEHFETAAQMPKEQLDTCLHMVSVFSARLRFFGKPVVFEHGARTGTGRSCGIYHAHLHLVPVPSDISIEEALPRTGIEATNLEQAYDDLKTKDTYLLFRDTCGRVRHVSGSAACSENYSSQYFRKTLVSHFDLHAPWDWRDYKGVEERVLDTLAVLRSHVVLS